MSAPIYQAITTKFINPTDTKGSRVKAKAFAGSLTLPWDHALNPDGNHAAAAQALATKMKWNGLWIGGGMPDQTGNVYVLAPTDGMSNYGVEASFVVERV